MSRRRCFMVTVGCGWRRKGWKCGVRVRRAGAACGCSAVEQAGAGDQGVAELAERLAPVTDGGLARSVDFPERAAIRRVIEDGVVAEPMRPAGFGGDFPFDHSCRFEADAIALREREARDEARGAAAASARGKLAI